MNILQKVCQKALRILTNTATVLANALGDRWPWFARRTNAFAINLRINKCRYRPHPWSTVSDYTSWTALMDHTWSARALPADHQLPHPPFDELKELFRRKKQRLSNKSTCLFPAFAQYLVDGFIQTDILPDTKPDNPTPAQIKGRKQNRSNHQIDLTPLYGRTPCQTDALRLKNDAPGQRGRLKSPQINGEEYAPYLYDGDQVKEEFKKLDEPLVPKGIDLGKHQPQLFAFGGDRANAAPQITMMNTLFLREHNRLAAAIEVDHPMWDDERVFQVARNISIVQFIKVVIEEYINHISPVFKFRADPSVAWRAPWNKPNWVTSEFSLLYRWHSLTPDSASWGGATYPLGETILNNQLLLKAGLKEGFLGMSAQKAGAIGPFNTPQVLLNSERMAIWQGQVCRLTSYSNYRAYASLPRPRHFTDISSNPAVVDFLHQHYGDVDNVEFYTGLFSEDIDHNSVLPPLMLNIVAVDAFSQALTNPLLSEQLWQPETFTEMGWRSIQQTGRLRDILQRNLGQGVGLDEDDFVGMTQPQWEFDWTI